MNTLTPVQETCFPAEEQYLFLGCSVMSFSVSMGLNGQQSELTVQLVEDTCAPEEENPKKFRDCLLREQDWTEADPGFFGELISIIGTPVYFRMANFEYAGIVQGWERVHSESNNPTYDVKIVDPRIILENTKIIMNDDTGIEPSILTNVFNALYWNEKERPGVGLPCPPVQQFVADGVIAGSLADWYGAANHNNNGLTWDDVLWMVESRINSADRTDYIEYLSSGGSVVHPQFGTIYGMGLLDETQGFGGYGLDLSEVPEVPSYYRFDNTASSLMDLLNQVIEDSGHDYYVELIPNKANIDPVSCPGYPGSDDPYDLIIKVRCIDRRTSVAATGSIETFVTSPVNIEKVMSYNEGRELRNDITESMIIGGQKQSVWQADNGVAPGSIIPYFGLDPATENVIIPFLNAGFWQFEMPTDDLAMQFNNARHGIGLPAFVTINERELIFAQSNFDVWHSYASAVGTDLYLALGVTTEGVFDIAAINALFTALNTNPLNDARVADFINASRRGFKGHEDLELEILNMAYGWINKIATEYYGKKFQVLVPFTCTKISLEAMQFINTEKPSDGGWTEEGNIVGLPNPGPFSDFFRHQDERFMPFIGINNASGMELSNFSQDSYITDGVQAWIKVNQEQEYVFVDKANQEGPRCVITLPQQIREVETDTTTPLAFSAIVDLAARFGAGAVAQGVAQDEFNDIMRKVGSVDGHEGMFNRALVPNGAAVCIESNLLRYGPYSAIGLGTKGGDVNLRIEEGLVPWEYAGYAIMDVAGTVLSSEGITKQQVIDKGTVTIAGYPDLPVGAEILAIENGSLLGNGSGYHLYENRPSKSRVTEAIRSDAGNQVLASLTVLNSGDKWQGTDGANITTISTRVGPQGIQTTYQMRVFTDKFGRFAKLNAKRLKTIGRWRIQLTRYFRAFTRHRLDLLRKLILDSTIRPGQIVESRWGAGSRTPAEVIVGQLGIWNNDTFQRPMIAQMPIAEASVEIGDDYDKKAMMSIDGLIRPVSIAGGGDLPKFANPLTNCQITASKGAQPPIDKEGEAGNLDQYNLDIDITYLNPFSNPNTDVPQRSDTPDHGHDIELLGRESLPPTGSLMMAPGGYLENGGFDQNDYSTDDDYRTFALRGPLVMQGWGYDLDGFPIPNAVDSDMAAKGGDFESENLQHKFMDNWLRKTETWPVAPIDLRFDRERAVWTIPQYRDLVVELKEDMMGGSGLAKRIEGPELYDSGGSAIANPEMYILDKVCASGTRGLKPLASGDKAIVRFDPYACEYYIVEVCREPSGLCTIDVDCCIPDSFRAQDCISGTSGEGILKLAFAKGIRSYTGAVDECPAAGTGITGDCCDLEPTAYLMAGISLTKWDAQGGDTCKPINEVDLPFVNELLVGDGMRVGTTGGAATGCSGIISAGIEFATVTTGLCPTGVKTGKDFVNKIWLGTGLHGASNDASLLNDCDYILSAGISLDESDSGCFTDRTQNIEFASRIKLGSGLRGASGDACEYHIGAGVAMGSNESCTSGDLNDLLPFVNRITFNKGISVQTGNRADECEVNIGAGVRFTNDTGCLTEDQDSSTTYLSNEIILNRGLRGWYDTERLTNDCNYSLAAGIDFTDAHQTTGTCLNIATSLTDLDLVNKINFAKGLAAETSNDPCEITIGAGLEVESIDTCIKDGATLTDMPFVSHFKFGKGIAVSGNETGGACDVSVGAGIEFASSPGCATGSEPVSFANKITLKDGLRAATGADCEALLAAGFKAQDTNSTGNANPLSANAFANSIVFGSGISMFSGASPCEIIITASGGGSGSVLISGSDDCISTDYTTQFKPDVITFAGGLHVQRVGDNANIGAGMSFANVSECITGEDNSITYANDFLIGKGLRVDSGNNACQAKIGAGFDFTTKSGICLDGQADGEVIDFASTVELTNGLRASGDVDNCKVTLGAGIGFGDGNLACITGNEPVAFFNKLTSARGIRGKSGLSDCELLLGAGVDFSKTQDCITGADDGEFINEIELGKGLASETGADCTLKLGAGFEVGTALTTCADTGQAIAFVNKITPLKGVRVKNGASCEAQIGAGVEIANSFDCITGSDTSPFISTLTLAGGLRSETGEDCEVKIGAGLSYTSSTATGATTATLDFANKLVLGSGLELSTGTDCEAIIWSTGTSPQASGTDECITADDTALVSFNKVKWAKGLRMDSAFEPTISVGAGMKWTRDTGECLQPSDFEDVDFASDVILGKGLLAKSGQADCEVILGAGVELENTTDCVDEEHPIPFASKFKLGLGLKAKTGDDLCEAIVGAGLDLTSTTDCITGTDSLNIDFVSNIEFGKGIALETGATPNCSAKIGAGVAFSNTSTCVSGAETINFANQIILGKGLASETGADCQAKLGAGFEIKDSGSNCISAAEEEVVAFASALSLGQGIRSKESAPCEAMISAGVEFSNTDECIAVAQDVDFSANIQLGKGLRSKSGVLNCAAVLGAGMEIAREQTCISGSATSTFISKFTFADGITSETGAACEMKIGSAHSYSNAGNDTVAAASVPAANKIELGSGLYAGPGSTDCSVLIYTSGEAGKISGCSDDACVTTEAQGCTEFTQITFGGGLRKEDVAGGHIRVGAGIGASQTAGCLTSSGGVDYFNKIVGRDGIRLYSDTECELQIGAGIAVTNAGTGCFDTGSSSAFATTINFGGGLRAKDDGTCAASVIAGPKIEVGDECGSNITPTTVELSNTFRIGSGLKVGQGSEDNCTTDWAAGLAASFAEGCPESFGNTSSVDFYNKVVYVGGDGYGITGESTTDCEIRLGAGHKITPSSACVKNEEERKWIGNLNVGKGLRAGSGDGDTDCEATIDLFLKVEGMGSAEGQKIKLMGQCAPAVSEEDEGDCKNIILTFADSGMLTVVTDVSLGACDIIQTKVPIQFCGTTGASFTGSVAPLTDCSGDLGCAGQ